MLKTITDILVIVMLAGVNILFLAILHKLTILNGNVRAALQPDRDCEKAEI